MDQSQNPNSGGDGENSNNNVDDLKSGPFSLLYEAVKNNVQILINVRNNHKYIARVKAYDRHMNLYVFIKYCCVLRTIHLHSSLHNFWSDCW